VSQKHARGNAGLLVLLLVLEAETFHAPKQDKKKKKLP
jgi:hypothetical protein